MMSNDEQLNHEIERLRVYVSGARCPHCDELRLELGEVRGENDRLRGALEAVSTVEGSITESAAKKDAEIERLREEVKLLNSFRPDAELARLRGLLRETLEDDYIHVPYGASHEDVSAIRDFEKRVREALGE